MKSLYILIGPKGSGKSHIGELVERRLGIPFFRVEPVFMDIRRGRAPDDPDYIREGFGLAEEMIRRMLAKHEEVRNSSTGAAEEFRNMLERLRDAARLLPIRVDAPFDLCLERIRSRDQSLQIPVSDDMIRHMDRLSRNAEFDFVATLRNTDLTEQDIVAQVEQVRRGRNGTE